MATVNLWLLNIFGENLFSESTNGFLILNVPNIIKKSDLTLIKINIICEVPFYFINKIMINKIIMNAE